MKKLKIAVGLPHYQGRSSFEHNRMWLEFGAVLNESRERFSLVSFGLVDECGIDRARNKCMEQAIEADADWLLMIDADTWVTDGGDLLQMISDADKAGATIVGAAVPRRRTAAQGPTRHETLMVYECARDDALQHVSLTPAGIFGRVHEAKDDAEGFQRAAFAPVDAIATACMAINMRHALFMDRPFFRFTDVESEDLDFCHRVRDMRSGWMLLDANGKLNLDTLGGVKTAWKGLILVDKRVSARHLNRPTILRGLEWTPAHDA